MKTFFGILSTAITIVVLATVSSANAQVNEPHEKQGSILQEKNSVNNFNTGSLSAAVALQLKLSLGKIKDVIIQNTFFKPPVGFNAVYDEFDLPLPLEIPWQKQDPAVIDFGLPEFNIDPSTHNIKAAREAFADLDIEINSFRQLYEDTYSTDIANSNYACPIFFFRYNQQLKDSTQDYIEYEMKEGGAPLRIITNGKPVFVPLTQEQYLNFQIQYNKKNADDATYSYVHDSVTIAAIPEKKTILNADRELIHTWQQRMIKHRQRLNSLNTDEKKQAAYIIWGAAGNTSDIEELSVKDNSNAQELWTINPDYFSKKLPYTAVQIIVVKPEYQPQMASDFIKTKVMNIYSGIDYKSLKALIQN